MCSVRDIIEGIRGTGATMTSIGGWDSTQISEWALIHQAFRGASEVCCDGVTVGRAVSSFTSQLSCPSSTSSDKAQKRPVFRQLRLSKKVPPKPLQDLEVLSKVSHSLANLRRLRRSLKAS